MILIRGKRILVIEVGSQSVKYILGGGERNYRVEKYHCEGDTEKLDKIHEIFDFTDNIQDKYIIGTAGLRNNKPLAYRIEEETGIKPDIIPGSEEAELSAKAFMCLEGKKYIGRYEHIISIDGGGLSTEVYVMPENQGYSMKYGLKDKSKKNQELKKLGDKFSKYYPDSKLYALCGKRVSKALGGKILPGELTRKVLSQVNDAILDVQEIIGPGDVISNPFFPAVGYYLKLIGEL